jgi:hypothetical protein
MSTNSLGGKRPATVLLLSAVTAGALAGIAVSAGSAAAATIEVSGYTALTTNAAYDRNPSIVFDGTDYWLFWTKGDNTSTSGVRGGGLRP